MEPNSSWKLWPNRRHASLVTKLSFFEQDIAKEIIYARDEKKSQNLENLDENQKHFFRALFEIQIENQNLEKLVFVKRTLYLLKNNIESWEKLGPKIDEVLKRFFPEIQIEIPLGEKKYENEFEKL